ncbi:MAG: hypothetical protein V3T17_10215 [Pseudomonadales bacterium]
MPLINNLGIDKDVSQHFARWAKYATKRQIKTFNNVPLKTLRILSFVETQYCIRQDYAFDAINKLVNSAEKAARKHEKNSLSVSDEDTQASVES